MNIPNVLSMARIAAVPLLLWLAWRDLHTPFLITLALTLFTDALDGFLARKLNQVTELGARLDSWGDLSIYTTVPLGCWWLWPELILRELNFVITVAIAFPLPIIAALIKFHTIASYHTWAVKLTAVVMAFGVLLMFTTGAAWLFQLGAILLVIAAVEEIAITLLLDERHNNVRTIWHAIALQKKLRQ